MDILSQLESMGVIVQGGHYVYEDGRHGSVKTTLDPLFVRPDILMDLAARLMYRFAGPYSTIAATSPQGVALALACALNVAKPPAVIWAVGRPSGFAFSSTFVNAIIDKPVLVVVPSLTSSSHINRVCRRIEEHGGVVHGVGAICSSRGITAAELGVTRLETLVDISRPMFRPDDCELCRHSAPKH